MNLCEGGLETIVQPSGFQRFAACTPFQDTCHQRENLNQESILGSGTQGAAQERDENWQHALRERSQGDNCVLCLERDNSRLEQIRLGEISSRPNW